MKTEQAAPSVLTIKRLSRYLTYLRSLKNREVETISTPYIAKHVDVHETQVRKDLALTGQEGKPKIGHNVNELIEALENYLNVNNITDAFLVGTGHLGTALLGYNKLKGFEQNGIKIVAAFDSNKNIIGKTIHGIEVFDIKKFSNLATRMNIHIGIITVPSESAEMIADHMIKSGILAIWNFAPVPLNVPENIIVENTNIESSIALISRRLAEKYHSKK